MPIIINKYDYILYLYKLHMAYYQGRFQPVNIIKYKGDSTNIIARSGWEFKFFTWLDLNPQVIEWASEEIVIPYICITDKSLHRYFVDVYAKFENGDKFLIEIKPYNQTIAPEAKRITKTYVESVYAYAKNMSKWNAAKQFAEKNGYKFRIFTENELRRLGLKGF